MCAKPKTPCQIKPSICDSDRIEFEEIWEKELAPVLAFWLQDGMPAGRACQHVAWHLFKALRQNQKN